jgi:predicted Zn-dependent protease
MTGNRIGNQIEALVRKSQWKQAQAVIEKQLAKEPGDHWLWARLSGVKYEQRDYPGALQAAKKALQIVADCPLALWSKAGALEMLGKPGQAMRLYSQLVHRGSRCWTKRSGRRRLASGVRCAGQVRRMSNGVASCALAQAATGRVVAMLFWGKILATVTLRG